MTVPLLEQFGHLTLWKDFKSMLGMIYAYFGQKSQQSWYVNYLDPFPGHCWLFWILSTYKMAWWWLRNQQKYHQLLFRQAWVKVELVVVVHFFTRASFWPIFSQNTFSVSAFSFIWDCTFMYGVLHRNSTFLDFLIQISDFHKALKHLNVA